MSACRRRLSLAIGAAALACVQCGTTAASVAVDDAARERGTRAFATVYRVLQHPRCMNCHPAGRVPLQGDAKRPHAQHVHGGDDGLGRYALRCAACHFDRNGTGVHTPPGAPNWHLPSADMPLVFEGRTPAQLAQQLADPARNGRKTPQQVLDHVAHDALVLWGWSPGDGRTPVDVPHADFVAAMRAWIDAGCPVPD
jgi:hypothetical protein